MVGLVEVAVWALIEVAVLFPMSEVVTVGAEGSSAMFFGYCLEFSKEV